LVQKATENDQVSKTDKVANEKTEVVEKVSETDNVETPLVNLGFENKSDDIPNVEPIKSDQVADNGHLLDSNQPEQFENDSLNGDVANNEKNNDKNSAQDLIQIGEEKLVDVSGKSNELVADQITPESDNLIQIGNKPDEKQANSEQDTNENSEEVHDLIQVNEKSNHEVKDDNSNHTNGSFANGNHKNGNLLVDLTSNGHVETKEDVLISLEGDNPIVESDNITVKPEVKPVEETKVEEVKPEVQEEKKELTELEAFKLTLAMKRREAKEKREREEKERQERLKLESLEQQRREEEARQMALDAIKYQKEAEEEMKKQEQEKAKAATNFISEEKKSEIEERQKKKAQEIKDKINENQLKKEKEKLERKKRLERIMQRTRGKKVSEEIETPEKSDEQNDNGVNHNHVSPTQNNGHIVSTTTDNLLTSLHSNQNNPLSNEPKLDEQQIVNSALVQ